MLLVIKLFKDCVLSPQGMKLLTIQARKKPSEAFLAEWIKMAWVGMLLVEGSC